MSPRKLWPTPQAQMPGAGKDNKKVKNLLTGSRNSFYLTQAIEAENQMPGIITKGIDAPIQQLTLFAGASPASLGPQPGSAEAQKMTVTSGRKCYELLKLSGRTGLLARMSEALFRWKWASTAVFLTWKISATPSKHLLSVLSVSAPRTDVIGAGLWPTMTVSSGAQTAENPTPGQTGGTTLWGAARMWPTPRAVDGEKGTRTPEGHQKERERRGNGVDLPTAAKMWPTPTGQDASNNGGPRQHERNSLPLNAAVMWPTPIAQSAKEGMAGNKGNNLQAQAGGSLNPTWVSWLMGYPLDWLDGLESPKASRESRRGSETASINSGRSEIASSPRSSSGSDTPSSRRKDKQ